MANNRGIGKTRLDHHQGRTCVKIFLGWFCLGVLTWGCTGSSQSSQPLIVHLEGQAPQKFTAADLSRLPRQTVRVRNHAGREETHGGIWLRDLLAASGAPFGDALKKSHLNLVMDLT